MLGLVGIAVALGTYPVIRRLTKRLNNLQGGVEKWGQGDLSTRVEVSGNDEVAFLAERFNTAASHIEALVASHKSLLANASHELPAQTSTTFGETSYSGGGRRSCPSKY